ncbi:DUF3823 domain-containing protein [Joostella atrarenae]|uniref:DUF3823 domain-containing protein n=1 Tax=Joostella atrarenae TaxID=679257 RepID=A0ABS9J3H9_9FLAO|nr:DUF3823 domain-containing protein [Joostella atrarenae]MCF8714986.1 DUF3823 domain-containing protein [Joostella atrarenae]
MKKIKYILVLLITFSVATSCDIDELDAPDSGLYGSIIDEATGELVQQDIIRGGELELREHGWENVSPQYMNYKVDGTFEDSQLFAASYNVFPIKTNFHPIDTIKMEINGRTKLDLTVKPYLRIKNPKISKSGYLVTATFSVEQTGVNPVKKIGLYAGADGNVGEPMRLALTELDINTVVDPTIEYTLTINVEDEIDLREGNTYFFRIGALYDAPNSRFNYASPVSIEL